MSSANLPIQKPSSGTPTAQDFALMQTTWARILNPLISAFISGDGVPVGTIWQWAVSVSPSPKFLVCSGQTVFQSDYPQLFRLIGKTYNTGGEPAGSFRLPAASGTFTLLIKAAS